MEVNDEFCMQWKGLVYKISKKYIQNSMGLDLDDLMQIAFIGLISGGRSYNEDSGVPLMNYLAKCISNSIFKEFQLLRCDNKKANFNSISLDIPTSSKEDISIGDTLKDCTVDVYQEVEDIDMYQFYTDTIYQYLDSDKAYILDCHLIKMQSFNEISKALKYDKSKVKHIFQEAKKELLIKSPYLRQKKKEYFDAYVISTDSIYKDSAERLALKSLLWEV